MSYTTRHVASSFAVYATSGMSSPCLWRAARATMSCRRWRYAASLKPGWSASRSAPASSVFVEKASMSLMEVGNHGTRRGARSVWLDV